MIDLESIFKAADSSLAVYTELDWELGCPGFVGPG
jgi:hypothetical protein